MQGVEIFLERPWRRETMHNLVKEIAGINFNELGNDLDVAKQVTLQTLGKNLDNKDKGSIEACQTVGHLLNEVDWLPLFSSFLSYVHPFFIHCI